VVCDSKRHVGNAMVHHRMGSLFPAAGQRPVCAQIFVLDAAAQLDCRMQQSWCRDLGEVPFLVHVALLLFFFVECFFLLEAGKRQGAWS
jgi:hypothetical protein